MEHCRATTLPDHESVRVMIEGCMASYMSESAVIDSLQRSGVDRMAVEACLTAMKAQDPSGRLFQAYRLRCQLKDQIIQFNGALLRQLALVESLRDYWMDAAMQVVRRPEVFGSHVLSVPPFMTAFARAPYGALEVDGASKATTCERTPPQGLCKEAAEPLAPSSRVEGRDDSSSLTSPSSNFSAPILLETASSMEPDGWDMSPAGSPLLRYGEDAAMDGQGMQISTAAWQADGAGGCCGAQASPLHRFVSSGNCSDLRGACGDVDTYNDLKQLPKNFSLSDLTLEANH